MLDRSEGKSGSSYLGVFEDQMAKRVVCGKESCGT